MSDEIKRASASFCYGFAEVSQLTHWMQNNPDLIGVGLVGRSNVGKSSLINSLFGNKTARVSKTPGRTRQVNIFEFELTNHKEKYYLFDLPGYGHAQVSKEMSRTWNELMNIFFHYSNKSLLMLNIQDARHPDQKVDQEFHDFLANYDVSTTLIFNKMDKLKKQKEKAQLKNIKPKLIEKYHWVKDIHFVSAESGQGLQALENSIVTFLLNRSMNQQDVH